MYDWHIRTSEISELTKTFCRLLEVEVIERTNEWTIIRCKTMLQRKVLQSCNAGLNSHDCDPSIFGPRGLDLRQRHMNWAIDVTVNTIPAATYPIARKG